MKVAVTGAAGYLGAHLTRALRQHGHEVTEQDRHGPLRWCFDLADVTKVRLWLQAERPDVVTHLAARTGRLFGEDDRRDCCRSNAEATVSVATVCAELGIRLAYTSSSEIYGDTGHVCTEDGPYAPPHNLYGLTKRWGEDAARLYAPDGLTIWRVCMPYGPGAKIGPRGYNALHSFLWRAHHRMPLNVHRGSSRSWTWVEDTVDGMLLTLTRPGVWNIGGDHDHRPMSAVAELACRIADAPASLIRVVPPPNAQTLTKRLSSAKLETLGWVPTMPLESGMKATYEWVARHNRFGVLDGPR